ncbi:MAG TPA: glycosyltransferase [Verrucomicrobiae bacterium]|nr:glycosyltransferase [Verrucomicrobiae bacterium]
MVKYRVQTQASLSSDESSKASTRLLANTWYEAVFDVPFESVDMRIHNMFHRFPRLRDWIKRSDFVRGILFFGWARRYPLVATTTSMPGTRTFFLLERLFGRRRERLILLQYMCGVPFRRRRDALWFRAVTRPALRKILRFAVVMTAWEPEHYARLLGLEAERFFFVPWPQAASAEVPAPAAPRPFPPSVIATGRVACDWETLFAAAEGTDWPLKVICTPQDLPLVRRLNRNRRAEVLCDIPAAEHHAQLCAASVFALCVFEKNKSIGHIRIRDAIAAGLPIVASGVRGVDGYLAHEENALLVPPGDPKALRGAIEKLLADPVRRETLARNAFERARPLTQENTVRRINDLVRRAVE